MTTNLTAFLENCGATPHLNNPTLMDELVSKLPINKREDWAKHVIEQHVMYPTVREFADWLQNVAKYVTVAIESSSYKNTVPSQRNEPKPTFTTYEERNFKKYAICDSDHPIYKCDVFKQKSVSERWSLVKSRRLCFCCRRQGHTIQNCTNSRECKINSCNKLHNRLLHEKEQTKKNLQEDKQKEQNTESAVTTATINQDSLQNKTLFKLLPVNLTGPKGTIKIKAFIDEESTISLIEEGIAKAIGAKGNENLLIQL